MKPTISVDNEHAIVTTRFAPDMTLDEIQEFLTELKTTVDDFGDRGATFSILNDAADKSFENLDAQRELSLELRKILAGANLDRYAIFRPQGDYRSDEEDKHPDRMKTFVTLEEANAWLFRK